MATRLFLDMDGVFCDFEKGVQALTDGISSKNYPDEDLWPHIMKTPFFENLDPMKDAEKLWDGVRAYLEKSGQKVPIFLTGCPKGKFRPAAEKGKEAWLRKHFISGNVHVVSVPVEAGFDEDAVNFSQLVEEKLAAAAPADCILIFCRPDQKFFFTMAKPTPILIDDRVRAAALWTSVRKDAIFIHHKTNPQNFTNKNERNMLSTNAVTQSVAKLSTMKGGRRKTRKAHKNNSRRY
jgi:hypothetical protein